MKKFSLLAGLLIIFCLSDQMIFGQTKSFEKFKYISPKSGSKFINPENTIAFRHGEKFDASSVKNSLISVTGSISGEITGKFKLSRNQHTLFFVPDNGYQFGEWITVTLNEGIKTVTGLVMEGKSFTFKVKEIDNTILLNNFYQQFEDEESKLNNTTNQTLPTKSLYKSSTYALPDDFPEITVMEYDNPTPGYTFYQGYYSNEDIYYLMVLDNYGLPVFYRKWPMILRDFRRTVNDQMMHAQRVKNDATKNKYYVLDKWYNIVDTLLMGNGYLVDPHDALLFENGDHLMIAYDPQPYAMDTVVPGGDPNATVTGLIVQELDADHNVLFQWRSWDHFQITDAEYIDLTAPTIDYVHGNAVEKDIDDNILISCRHMNEITKIDRNSAEIIWRFGLNAKNNMFTFDNDTNGFFYQHDINRIENGHITIHDNGNYHDPHFSQAVEYEIDEVNHTANLVWNYINTPDTYGRAQGSSQRLSNGNTLICWGNSYPIMVTEVDYNKTKTWELSMQEGYRQYRAHKYNWITDYFAPSIDTVDFGTYDDYVPWPYVIVLTNNSDEDIEITSTHNFTSSYGVVTSLPLTIPANGTANLTINFFPTQQGQINDVLTIRTESMFADTLHQMIARQVFLTGYVEDNTAPEASLYPTDGMTDVSQEEILTITFDESVVKADGSVLKTSEIPEIIEFKEGDANGEDVQYSAYINAWKKEITIVPDTLKPLQVYYLELKANTVADNSGNVLAEAITSTFTTAEEQGIIELSEQNFAKVYPNPNNGLVTIEFQNIDPKDIQVYDMKGNIVYSVSNIQQSITELNLQSLPSGVYVIKIKNQFNNKEIELKTLKN